MYTGAGAAVSSLALALPGSSGFAVGSSTVESSTTVEGGQARGSDSSWEGRVNISVTGGAEEEEEEARPGKTDVEEKPAGGKTFVVGSSAERFSFSASGECSCVDGVEEIEVRLFVLGMVYKGEAKARREEAEEEVCNNDA